MKKIIRNRGEGKSAELLLLAEQEGIKYIACSDLSFDSHINLAYTFGIPISFISYDLVDELDEHFLIDDLELFIKHKYKNCKGFTLSSD